MGVEDADGILDDDPVEFVGCGVAGKSLAEAVEEVENAAFLELDLLAGLPKSGDLFALRPVDNVKADRKEGYKAKKEFRPHFIPPLFRMMQVLFEILQDILELGQVRGVRIHQRLVRLDHRIHLLLAVGIRAVVVQGDGGPGAAGGLGIEGKKLVEAEVAEEVAVSLVQVDDVKVALSEFPEPERDARHRTHEGRIHRGTVPEDRPRTRGGRG